MRIENISTHNLRISELELPERTLVVITGPSGSGKSSLAFDTLAREGRRRYLLALSVSEEVRLPPPARVERVEDLPPAIALPQRIPPRNPRITVGTITGILEKFRRLAAEIGEVPCGSCGRSVRVSTLSEILDRFEGLPRGTRIFVTAPVGERSPAALSYLLGEGFSRFWIDGEIYDLTEESPPREIRRAEVVVDRIVVKEGLRMRLIEALRLAERLSGGPVILRTVEGGAFPFTLGGRCPECLSEVPSFGPEDFSFNHPRGACPSCEGLGEVQGKPCPDCGGLRLKPEALRVRLFGRPFGELLALSIRDLVRFLKGAEAEGLTGEVLRAFREDLLSVLEVLSRLGVGHLSLISPFHRLSTGERKRVELAAVLSQRLSGTLFVLDEPGLGLSPSEKETLLAFLRDLVFRGNTVVVVEHDPLFVRRADLVVELGPGAGSEGGRVLFVGPPEALSVRSDLPTGAFLSGKKRLKRSFRPEGKRLRVSGLSLLLEGLNVLCGASGAGKTRLLETLAAELNEKGFPSLFLYGELPGKTRGRVASFLSVFDEIRRIFAATPEARTMGLTPGHFSPFSREGRCPYCRGEGRRIFRISGLLETEMPCEECRGTGLRPEALRVTYRGLSLPEVLNLSVKEALSFFARIPPVVEKLRLAANKGLEYLRLGQDLRTLSGGEKLRLRLARELMRREGARFLLLDLPSMGLHLSDLERLLLVFEDLLRQGKTLILAENQPLLVLLADEIVVLSKGRVNFTGPPTEFLATEHPLARDLEPYQYFVEIE
ncbi:hypothetical protein [Thermosulfurimonas sp. F29]|uniref:hypothetical protein n=1 Tax=Thermosulfurimonas sp. F29 TaxID=2867247 RepID=UPI001C82ECA2|nr:hypothetical protein [Thermosulfurimonas sp. F29]MBX6423302.1 hypothetical protein [Thermosulfurimonas sp. F29]